jgi:TPR repeat protein
MEEILHQEPRQLPHDILHFRNQLSALSFFSASVGKQLVRQENMNTSTTNYLSPLQLPFLLLACACSVLLTGCWDHDTPLAAQGNTQIEERLLGLWHRTDSFEYYLIESSDKRSLTITSKILKPEGSDSSGSIDLQKAGKLEGFVYSEGSAKTIIFKVGAKGAADGEKWAHFQYSLDVKKATADVLKSSKQEITTMRLRWISKKEGLSKEKALAALSDLGKPEDYNIVFSKRAFSKLPDEIPSEDLLAWKLKNAEAKIIDLEAKQKYTQGNSPQQPTQSLVDGDESMSAEAQYARGKEHFEKKDYKEAIHWYRRAANLGLAEAQYHFGRMHDKGFGTEQNFDESIKWFRKAAEQGNAQGQNALGASYYRGEGVLKNTIEAVKWYRKAAEQGDANAQYSLGWSYANGEGVPKDPTEGLKWFRKAAAQGDAEAQYNIGWLYANGEVGPQNLSEAFKWNLKAAEQGYAAAQLQVGGAYHFRRGVEINHREAEKWYRKAAEQGCDVAQFSLGALYRESDRGLRNAAEAEKWYLKAAAQNNTSALLGLGGLYQNGEIGGLPDKRKALEYYRKAADLGDAQAKINIDLLLNPPPVQRRVVPCAQCGGKRIVPETLNSMRNCPRCNGSGADPRF